MDICEHCKSVCECVQVGPWFLCHEHKHLKQYQQKENKVYQLKRTPIKVNTSYKMPQVSKKRKKEQPVYTNRRLEFLKGKTCFIEGCTRKANTVEHTMGRQGYADDYAREKGITLFLDERFWKPCCLEHNLELENNSELSKKYQLSKISGKAKI